MRSWTSNLKRLPIGVYLWKFCIIEDLKLQYIIEGLFSQEEEEVEFRKKSSIISKLPNFISQSKQMQCIPSKSIGPKWKSKKFSKKGAAVKKGSTKSQEVFYLYLDTPQAVAKCILREFRALKRKPPEIQKDFWTLQNCLLLRFHILVI